MLRMSIQGLEMQKAGLTAMQQAMTMGSPPGGNADRKP
jgi:hypothetical protein